MARGCEKVIENIASLLRTSSTALTSREEDILKKHYLMKISLSRLAREYGISVSRVRFIRDRGLYKLLHEMRERDYV